MLSSSDDKTKKQGDDSPPQPPSFRVSGLLWIPFIIFWLLVWQALFTSASVATIPYSEFRELLAQKKISEVAVTDSEIVGVMAPTPDGTAAKKKPPPQSKGEWYRFFLPPRMQTEPEGGPAEAPGVSRFRTVRVEDPTLIEDLEAAGVEYTGVKPSVLSEFLWSWVLPFLLIFLVWMWLSRRLNTFGTSMLQVGKSKAKLHKETKTSVTFADIAGCDEAKAELQEVVDFLKNSAKYQALGANIPKGVLLVGPPGTGKTLLARAVAGEAEVAFYSISGADFVEMFVGVGAARVRDMFAEAKKSSPCIIFIDEIDAIGRHRTVHAHVANDEREQTLNQLLSEMDGFEPNKGIIVLAATNRPEVLDRALLRPGRFDRQVVIDAPDAEGRKAILKVHVRNKPVAPGVDLGKIAQATPGMSGADLANAVNEAALLATRKGKSQIEEDDFFQAIEKVMAGPERRSRRLGEKEKKRVAFHEAGHALVSYLADGGDPIQKISIVPRGKAALGYTWQLPKDEQYLMTAAEILARIRGLLGGRAAEELIFKEVSTGAQNDLEKATALARQMVCMYGMGALGLSYYGYSDSPFLEGPSEALKNCSPETARKVDEEVEAILQKAYRDAKGVLIAHTDKLRTVAEELLEKETIDGDSLRRLLSQPPGMQGGVERKVVGSR